MNAWTVGNMSRAVPRLSRPTLAIVVGLVLVALTACDQRVTQPPPRVIYLTIQSGDEQAAEVATALAQPLVVELRGLTGMPVKGAFVRFESGARGTQPLSAESDSLGRAWVWWQLGEIAGPQSIHASVQQPDAAAPVTFRALGLGGPPAEVIVVQGVNFAVLPGTELDTLAVLVTDRFANPLHSAPVSWSIESGGGVLHAIGDRTDANGRARAVWKLGPTLGTQSIVVASGSAMRRVAVTAAFGFVGMQVVAGSDHSCALTEDGTAYCWGTNYGGELGNGTIDLAPHPVPVAVATSLKFRMLASGGSHTCGLTQDGTAWCWGRNAARQTGSQIGDAVPAPTRVRGVPALLSITAGWFHTCGLTSGGSAWCWGDNSFGQLGHGADRSTAALAYGFAHAIPQEVDRSLDFSSIAATSTTTCGVTRNGVAYCWGENPERVLGGAVGQTCRIWSANEYSGEREEGEIECRTAPIPVLTKTSVSALALDRYGVCAILTTSELQCWGRGYSPTIVPGVHVSSIWVLWSEVCGEKTDGSVACWLMLPPFASVKPLGQLALFDLHSSGRHHCGLSRGPVSTVYCWGTNYDGALGDGTTTHRDSPVAVVWPFAASVAPGRSP
jgi:hypothetical protein